MAERYDRRGMMGASAPTFVAALIVVAFALHVAPLAAQALAKGAQVRVQVPDFGADWHDGAIGVSPNGCTMVYLRKKALGNYDSVALAGVARLQQQRDGSWSDVSVKPLLGKEPKPCREGLND
jgi:hypothetical protein